MSNHTCRRCGLKQSGTTNSCPACGLLFSGTSPGGHTQGTARASGPFEGTTGESAGGGRPLHSRFPHGKRLPVSEKQAVDRPRASAAAVNARFSSTNWLAEMGWRTLVGRIIAIDQPYQVARKTNWFVALPGLLLVFIVLPLILVGIIAAKLSLSWFRAFPNMFQTGFSVDSGKSSIFTQLLSYFLYGSLFGPKKSDTIRDIRVRDDKGKEHLVRIVGDLVAGNVNVGDEIEATGWNKRGTLIFRSGRNLRTSSDILTKRL